MTLVSQMVYIAIFHYNFKPVKSMLSERSDPWQGLPSSLRRVTNMFDFSKEIDIGPLVSRVASQLFNSNQSRPTLSHIAREFKKKKDKTVYLQMKWLIVLHQIIESLKQRENTCEIEDLLENMTEPVFQTKFESYFNRRLCEPYRQYLTRLIGLSKTNHDSPQRLNHEEDCLSYMKCNLVRYAIAQFTNPIIEFDGLLKKHYPFLCQYVQLLGKDLKPMYRELKIAYDHQRLLGFSLFELEQIINKLDQFTAFKSKQHLEETSDGTDLMPLETSPIRPRRVVSMMECGSISSNDEDIVRFENDASC